MYNPHKTTPFCALKCKAGGGLKTNTPLNKWEVNQNTYKNRHPETTVGARSRSLIVRGTTKEDSNYITKHKGC